MDKPGGRLESIGGASIEGTEEAVRPRNSKQDKDRTVRAPSRVMDCLSVTRNEVRELGTYGRQEVRLYSLGGGSIGVAFNLGIASLTIDKAIIATMQPWQQAMFYVGPWVAVVAGMGLLFAARGAGAERRETIEQIESEMGFTRKPRLVEAARKAVIGVLSRFHEPPRAEK